MCFIPRTISSLLFLFSILLRVLAFLTTCIFLFFSAKKQRRRQQREVVGVVANNLSFAFEFSIGRFVAFVDLRSRGI